LQGAQISIQLRRDGEIFTVTLPTRRISNISAEEETKEEVGFPYSNQIIVLLDNLLFNFLQIEIPSAHLESELDRLHTLHARQLQDRLSSSRLHHARKMQAIKCFLTSHEF
jgi:hypothetical protein